MYVETMLIPVKTAALDRYRDLATRSADIWRRHGALSVVEAEADDTPWGEATSYPRAVQLEADETLVVVIVTFPDKAARLQALAALEADPDFMALMDFTIISGKRMIWGGFSSFVAQGAVAGS
jgi:uncharacterized protein YbaA (DUF1428 family)